MVRTMNINFCGTLIALLFWIAPMVMAQPNHDATLNLTQQLSTFQSFKANFHQITQNEDGMTMQESFGEMAVEKPNRFFFRIERPVKQLIVSDGVQIWIDEPDLNQVLVKSFDEAIATIPVALLIKSPEHIHNHFTVTQLPSETPNTCSFQLTPLQRNDLFDTVILSFESGQLTKMVVSSSLSSTTIWTFSAGVIDFCKTTTCKNLFTFQIPKNADIVQMD